MENTRKTRFIQSDNTNVVDSHENSTLEITTELSDELLNPKGRREAWRLCNVRQLRRKLLPSAAGSLLQSSEACRLILCGRAAAP